MIWHGVYMERLLQLLKHDYPHLTFEIGASPCWSPVDGKVFYRSSASKKEVWALLHEVSHAHLRHTSYTSDVDLLQKEAAAWSSAQRIAPHYGITIDDDHVQDCLDTYRDWLYKRSTCPSCQAKGIQQSTTLYRCVNCRTTWHVTHSRFCRPYRRRTLSKAA